jgi:hypothetical protein
VEKAFEKVARNALAREKEIDTITDFPNSVQLPDQNQPTQRRVCC